jgi:heptosyltransferase-2
MALPASCTRRKFPEAHISALALPYVADIYRGQSVADELIAYDRKGTQAGIRGRERLAADLKLQNFDIALLLQNAFDAAWLTWRAGIPERIGYNRDGRGWLLTKAIDVPKTGDIPCHEKYYYLELLRRAGWIKTIPEVEEISLAISSDEVHRAEEKLGGVVRVQVLRELRLEQEHRMVRQNVGRRSASLMR